MKQKIENILEYMRLSEETHFEESGKPKNHILNDVIAVEEWLNSPYCPLVDTDELEEGAEPSESNGDNLEEYGN
jgi:hypothetical protein